MASIQLLAMLIIAAMFSFGSCLPLPEQEHNSRSTGPTWNWVSGILASGRYAVSEVYNKILICITIPQHIWKEFEKFLKFKICHYKLYTYTLIVDQGLLFFTITMCLLAMPMYEYN